MPVANCVVMVRPNSANCEGKYSPPTWSLINLRLGTEVLSKQSFQYCKRTSYITSCVLHAV